MTYKLRFIGVMTGLFATVGLALPTNAQTTFYTTRTDFVNASTNLSTVGFEGVASAGSFTPFGFGGVYSSQGVTFSAPNTNELFINSATYYSKPLYNLGSGDYLAIGDAPASLSIALPTNTTAVGFDLGTFDSSTSQISLTLSDGSVQTVSAPYPTIAFFGFTASNPITSINLQITAGSRKDFLGLDTFQFGQSRLGAVPAPSSLLAMTVGGVFLMIALRRRFDRR